MDRTTSPMREGPVFGGGYQAISSIAKSFGIQVTPGQIIHHMGRGRRSPDLADMLRAAKLIGLKAKALHDPHHAKLSEVPTPCLIQLRDESWMIYQGETAGDRFRLFDPITRKTDTLSFDELRERVNGSLILLAKTWGHQAEDLAFGISWFTPSIKRYKKPLIEMLILSFFINLLALGFPLCFQLVVDKVLSHKSLSTLVVVISALVLLAVFNALLTHLRQYLLQHTANRIDVELGAKLFGHLLHLPISFFEARPAGVIVTRARELQRIRTFLTGQAPLTAVDAMFIFIYVGVLFIYSTKLTWLVLATLPLYAIVGAMLRPALRKKLKSKFRSWASGQQLMVETIVGMQTVKASAMEPIFQRKWEERLAAYAQTAFQAKMLGVTASTVVTFVSQITTALLLFFGTLSVLNGDLTVGGMIAFNMIARLMAKPIIRIAQLWQDFQEVQVSIEHLSDIFSAPLETHQTAALVGPQIEGEIEFRNVGFTYKPDLPLALNRVTLSIAAGEVIGIVGPSGSGKSTMTKLLQRFHMPTFGEILIDGLDIAEVDPVWLRRQLGVVLQENFLFNESVHENIAMARPDMTRSQVMRVAQLAGADEFISRLPNGYDSKIEERGANLSGGQRQRLAIARALATNPRILILDEATSALDYDSERIIQNNMDRIVQGRTVIIIAHRLAAVRNCDRIVGMIDGEIAEIGTHDQLLRRRGGLYAHLWSLQSEHLTA